MSRDAARRLMLAKRVAREILSAGGSLAVAAAAAQAHGKFGNLPAGTSHDDIMACLHA